MKKVWLILGICFAIFILPGITLAQEDEGKQPEETLVKEEIPKPSFPEVDKEKLQEIEDKINDLYYATSPETIHALVKGISLFGAEAAGILEAHRTKAPWRVRNAIASILDRLVESSDKGKELAFYTLIQLLGDNNWQVRYSALRALGKCKNPKATAYVAELLQDRIWRVRQAAVGSLGNLEDMRIAPHLFEMLKLETEEKLRDRIMEALGALKYEPAKPLIYEILDNGTPKLKLRAFRILVEMDGLQNEKMKSGLAILIQTIKYSKTTAEQKDEIEEIAVGVKTEVIPYVIDAMKTCPLLENFKRYTGILERVKEFVPEDDTVLTTSLESIIRINTENTQRVTPCLEVLDGRPVAEVAPLLKKMIEGETSEQIKQAALQQLVRYEGAEIEEIISYVITDDYFRKDSKKLKLLNIALQAAASTPSLRYWDAVLLLYKNRSDQTKTRSLAVIKRILDKESDNKLIKTLVDLYKEIDNAGKKKELFTTVASYIKVEDTSLHSVLREFFTEARKNQDVNIRSKSLEGLSKIGSKSKDLETFQEVLKDPDENYSVRKTALDILSEKDFLDKSTAKILTQLYATDDSDRLGADAVRALHRQFQSKDLYKNFAETLGKDLSSSVRRALVNSLSDKAEGRVIDILIDHLESGDYEVKKSALTVLANSTEDSILNDIQDFYRAEKESDLQEMALKVLFQLNDKSSMDIFLKVIKDGDKRNLRISAIEAVGKLGAKEAVEILVDLLTSQDTTFRNTVIKALGKIGDEAAIPHLVKLLNSDSEAVLGALANFKGEEVDARIIEFVYNAVKKDLPEEHQNDDHVPYQAALYIQDYMLDPDDERGNRLDLVELQFVKATATDPANSEIDAQAFYQLSRMAYDRYNKEKEDLEFLLKSAEYKLEAWQVMDELDVAKLEGLDASKLLRYGHTDKATYLLRMGRKKAAVKALEDLLEIRESAKTYNSAAWWLIDNKVEVAKGVEWAESAVELAPEKSYILDTLGWGYFENREFGKAEATMQKAIDIDEKAGKKSLTYRFHMAMIVAEAGHLEDCIHWLEFIVEQDYLKYDRMILENKKTFDVLAESDDEKIKQRYAKMIAKATENLEE